MARRSAVGAVVSIGIETMSGEMVVGKTPRSSGSGEHWDASW